MNILISNTSEKPIYQQIFEQISAQILKGELQGGYSLPPIRQAAVELQVSIITVKKAWEELERSGLIYTVTGKGCFITELSAEEMIQKRHETVLKQMESDIAYYRSFGLRLEEVIELLRTVYE
ncbi:GntR family transcriptional regulator [Saccharibacillus alkalitolerans]|uniref:GntR family transcriptional regulator n=1 Tax=Saccharibacillus alkalitolerans TaxID=2705290 RepID=A0ABX0F507_9BACL|nr:GntR family transcriptional regulator [Saccharibacillus alkalitolerans]NGZ74688.1 GntR family transcriptional regulator [Saccharibacillus alkalitolerans]